MNQIKNKIEEEIKTLIDKMERGMVCLSKTKFDERAMWIKELNKILEKDGE